MKSSERLALVVVLVLVPVQVVWAGSPMGIGVVGDSYSDEYQFYPPDRSTARNWNEILASTRGLNFGQFSSTSRGEPRNQGYAYNWARSDATTADVIKTGQHTGIAAQVSRGEIQLVWIFVGGNDFINALKSPSPHRAIETTLPRALANYKTAVETILSASPEVKLVLVTVPDIRYLPEFAQPLRAGDMPPSLADEMTEAIERFNAQIKAIADREPSRFAVVDFALGAKVADLLNRDYAVVAGRRLDRTHPSNDIDHFFLADVRHPGTVAQGLLAQMFISTVNAKFDAGIPPLTSEELIRFASSLAAPRPELASRDVTSAAPPQPVKPILSAATTR